MVKMKKLLLLINCCCMLLLHLNVHTVLAKAHELSLTVDNAYGKNANDTSMQATKLQRFSFNNSTNPHSAPISFGSALNDTADIYKIVLGLESSLVRSVPERVAVQLTCRFFRPIWYRGGKLLENASKIITLKSLQLQDAGTYSCYTPTGLHGMQWSNLTLKVELNDAPKKLMVEDDIAELSKIEDAAEAELHKQQLDELVQVEIVATVEPYTKRNESLHSNEHVPPKSEANLTLAAPKFKSPDNLRKHVPRSTHGTVYLNCPALGDPIPNITWLLNDTALNVFERKYKLRKWSLSVEDLSLNDTGFYKCVICNKFGCIDHTTKVSVLERGSKPEQATLAVRMLANVTVTQGGPAQLECAFSNDFEPQIIWLKHRQNGSTIENMEKSLAAVLSVDQDLTHYEHVLELSTSADEPFTLRLDNVQLADEGWYTCIVSAAAQSSQSMASGYLKVLPTEEQLQESTELLLNADGSSKMDSYEKMAAKPKLAKMPTKLRATELEVENQFKHNLTTIENTDVNAELNDTDNDNKDGDLSGEEESAPKFKKSDKMVSSIHKPAGSSVQIMCPAIGNPAPNITWTRNSTEITRHIGKVTYKKWSIQMEDIITADSGVYKCTLCNKYGCIEHTTKLTINDRLRSRPIISDKFPQNQTVLTNSSAVLECRVVSDLEPYILWIKYTRNNKTIRDLEKTAPIVAQDADKHEQYARDFVKMPTDPDKPHVLRMENVTHGEEGWYTCIAANALGQSMASAYLKVVDKLPGREVYNLLRSHPIWITVVAIIVVLLFLLGSIFIIYVLRKLKHEKLLKHRIETVHQWTKKVIIYKPASCDGSSSDLQVPVIKIEKQRTTFQTSANVDTTQGFNEYEFPLDSNWEIPRSQLALGSTLGEGAFGRVVMAEACGLSRTVTNNASNSTIVAVKMVKEEHTDADMASLVREMEVMKMIGKHINIINLLGCCTQCGPLWVIVEFAPHGNLKDFLKKNRPLFVGSPSLQRNSSYLEEKPDPPLTEKNLISFAFQIARGMEYLASRRCIHRDLAARNVLVSDDYVMKIADFGLARDIQDTDYYRKNTNGRLPIKWMAPESLQEKFYDSQSDVWSYGVLLWEIMNYGEQPYPNIMSAEELYSYLITGQRMEKPPRCSLNIYMLMRQCWHFDASARPIFVEIVENLEKILQLANTMANEDYLDLSMPMLETPPSSSDDESEPETFKETSPLRYQYTYKFN